MSIDCSAPGGLTYLHITDKKADVGIKLRHKNESSRLPDLNPVHSIEIAIISRDVSYSKILHGQ